MKKSKRSKTPEARVHVFYSGRVQGVGFRYTAERMALELGLTGCVKNLHDGRVELICEGPKLDIERLLTQIKEGQMGSHIRQADCSWETPSGKFKEFCIEFCY